MIPQPHTQPQS